MPRSEFPAARRTDAKAQVAIRLVFTGLVLATTGGAAREFHRLLAFGRPDPLDIPLLALFAVLVAWLAANFWIAALGAAAMAWRRATNGAECKADLGHPIGRRLVVLMPICGEDVGRVFAGLQAMYRSLEAEPRLSGFHLFVLSDTRDVAVARREELACSALIAGLDGAGRIFYRRRSHNGGRKAGNIQDFCERWGGHYDYMLVLDADSLMDGPTVLRMADRMEADPLLALLQSWPRPVRARSLFGRLQQFAASVQGRVSAEGLGVLMGDSCSYWGHNALIRVRAFAGSCGLPVLPGRPPIGGEILSHDFVEAALLVADGWKVRMMADRAGSFEEPPPSLIASARRDRRWCQGNLQHLQLVAAPGLAGISRFHFLMGVMAYLSSPLWLLFLALGVGRMAAGGWPVDAGSGSGAADPWILVGLPLLLLLLPRAFGLIATLADPQLRRGHGGVLGLTAGTVLEIGLTTLMAPVMMLLHSRFVAEVLLGRSSGWGPQRRAGDGEPFVDVLRVHLGHTLVGIVAAGVVGWTSPTALQWLAPVVLGLVLAAPLSWLGGRVAAGEVLRRLGLFRVPEEAAPPAVVVEAERSDLPAPSSSRSRSPASPVR